MELKPTKHMVVNYNFTQIMKLLLNFYKLLVVKFLNQSSITF